MTLLIFVEKSRRQCCKNMNPIASKKLSYLYFLMTAMIIGLHSVNAEYLGFEGITYTINQIIRIFFDSATGAFFFFSAFLLYRKDKKVKEVILSRIRTLIIPYFIYNVIAFLYKQILRNVILFHALPTVTIRKLGEDILLAGANPPLWFIRVLFEFSLMYPIIKWIIKNRKLSIGIIFLAIIIHFLMGGR